MKSKWIKKKGCLSFSADPKLAPAERIVVKKPANRQRM